ncbi:MAG: hypothetical protein KJN67_02770 [Pontiella sp.]|nr:hypothetical protein [Pontiella sp.]
MDVSHRTGMLKRTALSGFLSLFNLFFLNSTLAAPAASEELVAGFRAGCVTNTGIIMPYRYFVPDDYNPNQKYPIVVYLHGRGGVGTDNLKHIIKAGKPHIQPTVFTTYQKGRPDYKCIVLAPQSNGLWTKQKLEVLYTLIDDVFGKNYSIDMTRKYLTGNSGGAAGAYISLFSEPQYWTAAVITAGRAPASNKKEAMVVQHLPLWSFHGANDHPERDKLVYSFLAPPFGNMKFTEIAEGNHNSARKYAFNDLFFPELADWLFAQKKAFAAE